MTATTGVDLTVSRAEYCVIACAEAWRGNGEVLAAAMGTVPVLGARLAKLTFEPDLLIKYILIFFLLLLDENN